MPQRTSRVVIRVAVLAFAAGLVTGLTVETLLAKYSSRRKQPPSNTDSHLIADPELPLSGVGLFQCSEGKVSLAVSALNPEEELRDVGTDNYAYLDDI